MSNGPPLTTSSAGPMQRAANPRRPGCASSPSAAGRLTSPGRSSRSWGWSDPRGVARPARRSICAMPVLVSRRALGSSQRSTGTAARLVGRCRCARDRLGGTRIHDRTPVHGLRGSEQGGAPVMADPSEAGGSEIARLPGGTTQAWGPRYLEVSHCSFANRRSADRVGLPVGDAQCRLNPSLGTSEEASPVSSPLSPAVCP